MISTQTFYSYIHINVVRVCVFVFFYLILFIDSFQNTVVCVVYDKEKFNKY